MKAIVARVLASNESDEESVLMLDPLAGGIASMSFCLEDILARGEKRRFCIIVTHPQSDELVRQWPLVSVFLTMLLGEWSAATKRRLTLEYSTFPDLERSREEARKRPMRSLMRLISQNTESEETAFKRVHSFFERVVPVLFGVEPLRLTGSTLDPTSMTQMKQRLELEIPLVNIVELDLDSPPEKQGCLGIGNGRILALGETLTVKPLSVWILEFVQKKENGLREIETLLAALLSGIQILIYGDDSFLCANLALSLSQILPRPLRRVTVFAEEYLMPYENRIISFSESFCQSSHLDHGCKFDNEISVMDTVCVSVSSEGHIASVHEYDERVYAFAGARRYSPHKLAPTPNIVAQIVELFRSELASQLLSWNCRMLQLRIESMVNEYVIRGRVYTRLFRHHEIRCNKGVLGLGEVSGNGNSSFTGIGRTFRQFIGCSSLRRWYSTSSVFSSPEQKHVLRGDASSFLYSLEKGDLNAWVTTISDHNVLLFLGSSSDIM
ncbi:uncharacterized protein Tco025E_09156 [Trypanosoma conorhini]|uniref:Folliculin/SMCR8 longin domain-containing protein n=1 Tax=Trypanosoma conorhini TaxID=83891 RepID=A0A3R7KPH5_9TRYP|nr:uncharacterized protein Tco025E_09156 [Trypanosoma conorhini]RNE98793.1 hypothetical protein Tco025E_09156 [Trypanosoma conorhini]